MPKDMGETAYVANMNIKYFKLGVLSLLLALLSGCSDHTPSDPSQTGARYHNEAYDAFLLTLSRLSNQNVQPIPHSVPINPKVAKLGKALFFSPELSANNTVACATCHIISQGGDDNRPVSIGIMGRKGTLNAPTVLNSGFNIAQFWDGRAATLEEQVADPITNPNEMGFGRFEQLVEKLADNPKWRQRFMETFGEPPTGQGIRFAIAEYERSLITPNSRFDQYLQGNQQALSDLELQGWRTFQRLGCISCHQGINLGGTLFQKAGIFKPLSSSDENSRWLGRYAVTGHEADKHVFKVPSLRNIAETAPYFHDGSVPTLEVAVRRMIQAQLGLTPQPEDIKSIVAFLKTLSAPVKEAGLAP